MTFAALLDLVRKLIPAYDTAAPHGLTRYVVGHMYGAESHYADDANLFDFPRVQLDVYTQSPEDELPWQVMDLLRAWNLPYTVVDMVYDDETALHRTILQLEVTGP